MSAPDPITRFEELFARARTEQPGDPTAMSLATASADGRPSVRMVLLKGVDPRGFVFYTNQGSRKARELDRNPRAALCIHWPAMGVQVRVEGSVERVTDAEADAYFSSRPRGSQVGAWASRQSQPIASREELEARVAQVEARFGEGPIPRPPFWGGYRVLPEVVEMWQADDFRLHDRTVYTRSGSAWTTAILQP